MNASVPAVRRLVAAALLLLASLGGVATAWAEGMAERDARAVVAHVEADGGVACAPAHDHAHCGFCRALRDLPAAPVPAAVPPMQGPVEITPPADARAHRAPALARAAARSPPGIA